MIKVYDGTEFPNDAICKLCGRNFAAHWKQIPNFCEFEAAVLAGGAITPSQEREAYERAMRGEA